VVEPAGPGQLLIVAVFHAWFDIATTSPLGPELLPTVMGVGVTLIGLIVLRHLLRTSTVPPGPSRDDGRPAPASPPPRPGRRDEERGHSPPRAAP
jgi:hypothetical protein